MEDLCLKAKRLLSLSIAFSVVSSLPLLSCVFLLNEKNPNKALMFIFPMIFWLGLIAEQVLFWKSNALRKRILKDGKYKKIHAGPGLISIFQNKPAKAFDVLLAVSLLTLLLLMATGVGGTTIQYILIFLFVLSFRLHCILNGKNFKYINNFIKKEGRKVC